jgi:C-terminal peptidase prc
VASSPPLRWFLALFLPLVFAAALPVSNARAQAQPSSAPIIREGMDHLINLYIDPLQPDALLYEAWNGAVAAAIAAGVNDIPELGALPAEKDAAWETFRASFRLLELVSEGSISSRDLAYAALEAMTEGRNECHSYFLDPDQYARFRESLEGRQQFAGIGVQLQQGPPFVIVNVYADTPAARAGLQPGDEIVAVEGVPARELNQTALSGMIRGMEGTPVTLSISREGDTFDVTITRAIISVPILTHTLRADGIGVIALNTFAPDGSSERQLRAALRDLEARGATGWILDLRTNSGGAVTSVQSVLGAFLGRDTTAMTLQPRNSRGSRLSVTGEAMAVQRPLAVLVGPASASGSEITAAVLQDTGRARVFGQRTAACANAGIERRLSDGSAMVVTSARLLAGPQQRPLDGIGVTPDEETVPGAGDPTLQAAVAYLLGNVPGQAGVSP